MNDFGPVTGHKFLQPFWVALIACLIGGVVLVGHRYLPLTVYCQQLDMPIPYLFFDSDYYIKIAEGKLSEVSEPYSKRVLYPWMAGELSRNFHMPLSMAFLELNFLGFAMLAWCLAALLQRLKVNPWWALLGLLTPLPLESLQRAYLPDLFHMALLALFFLLIAHDLEIAALVVLLTAFLTRDNTVILCLVVCLTGWWYQKRVLLWGGMLVLFLGLACESWFVHLGQPNRHHLPEILYLALFVPCSFLGNILGIVLWTDAGGAEGTPLVRWPIPHALQLGADHEIYLTYQWFRSFETFSALLSLFGCGPLLLWHLWKKARPIQSWAFAVQLAFAYGLISYFLGTTVGRTGTFRLIGYAWPLFWIALPWLFSRAKLEIHRNEIAFLIAASLLIAWIPNLEGRADQDHRVTLWMAGIPLLYGWTAICYRRIEQRQKAAISES